MIEMSSEEEKAYKYSMLGSLIIIGLSIALLILSISIFIIGEYGFGSYQMFQITVIIVSGMLFPAVIFILSFPRFREFFKTKIPKTNLVLGIIIIAIAVTLIIITAFWINYMTDFLSDPVVAGLSVGLIICLVLGIAALALCAYGGILNVLNYLKPP